MTRIATVVLSAMFATGLAFTALPVQAATLSTTQIQAVTNLLVAFGVDSATIATVQAALTGATTTPPAIVSATPGSITAGMIGYLRLGDQGDQVKYLQALLAADPGIYPQGLITGYFGALTQAALERYQERHGLDQVGFIGPQTLKNLKSDLDDNPLAISTSTPSGACAIVPPGHLIAPGWLKHHEGEDQPIVPPCQVLPPGIAWQYGGATTTPDTTAPVIWGALVHNVSATAASVSWATNENATGIVDVGTTTSYGLAFSQGTALSTIHTVQLTGLTASTTYHARITSADASGNTATSSDLVFTTGAAPDTAAPVITAVSAGSITASTTVVTWTTNEQASGKVSYGTTTVYGSTTPSSAALSTAHSVTLSGLTASTVYHFAVTSADASGNAATSSDMTFTTSAPPDTTPPVLSAATVRSIASTTATVSWTTNENATSKVYFGTTTPLSLATAATVSDSTLVTSHVLSLSGLATSTAYYYVIQSADASGNAATTTEASFTTTN